MSVNVANESVNIIAVAKATEKLRKGTLKNLKESSLGLSKVLEKLLNERLPSSEVCQLNDEGFKLKNPTRKTALMIALYKKAVSGDLSAIKEIRSIVSGSESGATGGTVMIVDDI